MPVLEANSNTRRPRGVRRDRPQGGSPLKVACFCVHLHLHLKCADRERQGEPLQHDALEILPERDGSGLEGGVLPHRRAPLQTRRVARLAYPREPQHRHAHLCPRRALHAAFARRTHELGRQLPGRRTATV